MFRTKAAVSVHELHELRKSGGARGETFKAGVDNAGKDLADAYAAAREKFTKAA